MHSWHGIIVALTALSLISGCASSPYTGTGAVLGGGLGAVTGAAIASGRNPVAGALIGGLVGTGLGAAGGYMLQQRQTAQPYQGSYYPPPPQAPYGYRAPAPGPAYGYNSPPAGPRYSANSPAPPPTGNSWNTPAPVAPEPGYGREVAPPEAYSQAPQSNSRTPIRPAPYNYQQAE